MRIYIVKGEAGSYDSAHEWLVKAFRDQSQAVALAERLNVRSDEWIRQRAGTRNDHAYYDYPPADWFAEDPNNQADYLGAVYSMESVELVEP